MTTKTIGTKGRIVRLAMADVHIPRKKILGLFSEYKVNPQRLLRKDGALLDENDDYILRGRPVDFFRVAARETARRLTLEAGDDTRYFVANVGVMKQIVREDISETKGAKYKTTIGQWELTEAGNVNLVGKKDPENISAYIQQEFKYQSSHFIGDRLRHILRDTVKDFRGTVALDSGTFWVPTNLESPYDVEGLHEIPNEEGLKNVRNLLDHLETSYRNRQSWQSQSPFHNRLMVLQYQPEDSGLVVSEITQNVIEDVQTIGARLHGRGKEILQGEVKITDSLIERTLKDYNKVAKYVSDVETGLGEKLTEVKVEFIKADKMVTRLQNAQVKQQKKIAKEQEAEKKKTAPKKKGKGKATPKKNASKKTTGSKKKTPKKTARDALKELKKKGRKA
tara:strand:- start:1028 stop:2209 length:1182 start_codon:yes stop_codon:yes gene_type:complete